jgi:hypothetical protein
MRTSRNERERLATFRIRRLCKEHFRSLNAATSGVSSFETSSPVFLAMYGIIFVSIDERNVFIFVSRSLSEAFCSSVWLSVVIFSTDFSSLPSFSVSSFLDCASAIAFFSSRGWSLPSLARDRQETCRRSPDLASRRSSSPSSSFVIALSSAGAHPSRRAADRSVGGPLGWCRGA